jgi:hypothetical protein
VACKRHVHVQCASALCEKSAHICLETACGLEAQKVTQV